jgi:pimeloyl-ACP methyl ester carboxylesterase
MSVQVLLHGNTYDHRYWDAGVIGGANYSYAQFMAQRDHHVLALDLPGTGDSARPDGDEVNFEGTGAAITEIIARLRRDADQLGTSGARVVLIGHSLGAILAVYIQSRRSPADILIPTGVGVSPLERLSHFQAGVIETALEDKYIRLDSETRGRTFYHPASADPEVIEFDNHHLRTAMPRGIYRDAVACRRSLEVSGAADITCPVYIQLGANDPVAPASNASAERACWTGTRSVEIESLPEMGHCFNLHRNRELSWTGIDTYLRNL